MLAPAQAQQRVYDVVLQGVPLEEALTELMISTDLVLGFDQRLVAGRWTSCVVYNSTGEEALKCVLKDTGLDYFRLPSGLYVLTERAEARIKYGALHGIVVDDKTGEPLEHAHIMLHPGRGTTSNQDGRFIFGSLEPGLYAVTTSYIGYSSPVVYVRVRPDSVEQTRLGMQQNVVIERTPIVVDGLSWRVPSDTLGQHTLHRDALKRAAGGLLPDVGRALSTLVGVRLSDATADLHIQSSGTGEHQYRLDNAPVFVPVSIGGLVGPFSTYALSRLTVHKTGFGADIGSQTAGVIEATHALGPRLGRHIDVHVDPMSVNARASHNLEDGSAIMAATRIGLWDMYAPPAVHGMLRRWNQTDQFMYSAFRAVPQPNPANRSYFDQSLAALDPRLYFSDVHFALRKRNGVLSSAYASAYWGRRQLASQESLDSDKNFIPVSEQLQQTAPEVQDHYVWDNFTGQIRYEAVLSGRVMASAQARASLFRLQHEITTAKITQQAVSSNQDLASQVDLRDDNGNRVREYGLSGRITYALWRGWNMEAGIEPAFTHSRFLVNGTRTAPIAHASGSWRVESYLQNRIPFSARLTLDAGTRVTYLHSRRSWFAEPRMSVRYDVSDSRLGPWSARLATGLYRQYVTQFDVTSRSARALRSSSRMWMALDQSVAPPKAAHISLEAVIRPSHGWSLHTEGYYKRLMHLLSINYVASTSDPGNDQVANDNTDLSAFISEGMPLPSQPQASFLSSGSGYAYGVNIRAGKRISSLQLLAGYEFSHTVRSFGEQFEGRALVAPWNEPHRVELEADLYATRNLVMQARWQSIWGKAWGFRQSYYDFLGAYGKQLLDLLEAPRSDINTTGFDLLSLPVVVEHIRAYRLEHPEEHRLPAVYQLDLSVAYTYTVRTARVQVRADAINVLGFNNVADWGLVSDPDAAAEDEPLLIIQERSTLPVTPSLALRLIW